MTFTIISYILFSYYNNADYSWHLLSSQEKTSKLFDLLTSLGTIVVDVYCLKLLYKSLHLYEEVTIKDKGLRILGFFYTPINFDQENI